MEPPSVITIERRIIAHLAEALSCVVAELDLELRRAAEDLPVEPDVVVRILPTLEAEFGVALPKPGQLGPALVYGRELARVIHGCLPAESPLLALDLAHDTLQLPGARRRAA